MKTKELRTKSAKELGAMANALKEKEQTLRFQLAAGKVKNVRQLRATRKAIAQALTLMKEKQTS